ncbi:MAG: glycosyltransferase family 2 protein [Sulfuricurvum sp.]|uniref:glycosyltransferase family 2 protein n=1 Tax=Sulfuricurvum sp. TaxID=2025608 RepID=UPI00260AB9FD|nr:glycosyltransferase family 2 protein [Sulfuricurvum sp.]MDD2829465.1 glycosyltransferase family 2 protein [Sulfuricurvum sp.]MDD4948452.1 glycosyltransferase family 2 protein [Sulfuricurvum sp.]
MKSNSLCIIIPVYNNPNTIAQVVNEVMGYSIPLIVVDDGSERDVASLIGEGVTMVTHETNHGKGVALRSGATKAYEMGYKFCLTMDGDAQHFAEDIPKFLEKFSSDENELIIGVRDFEQCNPPKSSVIGRRIGNFWVWVESGVWVSDTQTGFRLYPVDFLRYPSSTTRYEFEIENLVRFLWSGGKVSEVSVKTVYDESRITHFDKLKDNFYMTVLHTKLVLQRIFLFRGILKHNGERLA